LCEAATQQKDGGKMLANLERENLFIIPLDDKREWYRYHHIFADVLRDRLEEDQPDQVPRLHQRASDWYAQNDLISDAIQHALVADDFERVACLAELSWEAMDGSFQTATWLDWVTKIPDESIHNRPVLCAQYAWALNDCGYSEDVEARLQAAEKWLNMDKDDSITSEMIVVDNAQFKSLPAMIALARSNNAQYLGDPSRAIKYAELALELIPEEDLMRRAQATAMLGMTNWESGNLDAARKAINNWFESMQQIGNLYFAIASAFALADIMIAQGSLHEAVNTYQQSLQLASEEDENFQRIIAHHHLGLAMLFHEMGDQEASDQHMQKCERLGEISNLIDWPYRWHIAQAQLKESAGDLDAALGLLEEAKRVYIQNPVPDTRPVEALKAKIFLKQGRLKKVQDWVCNRGLSVNDELSYLNEFEYIVLARRLITQYQKNQNEEEIHQAISLLDRLLLNARDNGWNGYVLEILIVQALAYEAQGETAAALKPLEQALTLAEPEGYQRIFVDEGSLMTRLLYAALERGIAPAYAQRLLAAVKLDEPQLRKRTDKDMLISEGVEPLSEREIEVLQLISDGLTNQEIASQLYISLNTVKGHARNIYGKLGVKNRTQAIAKGKSLGILAIN
jgi:LuxR family maltose regulon positive regulatory protein